MEIGRESLIFDHKLSVKRAERRTVLLAAVLIGHLVGCSGGILFLAEFVVTSLSLVLGGAATISSNAIESWIYFSCYSTVAFWGYLIARVGLVTGMRRKKCSGPSLCFVLLLSLASGVWTFCLMFCDWDLPTKTMIIRIGSSAFFSKRRKANLKPLRDELQ